MNKNLISSERRAISLTNQKPVPYSTIWDDHPEYVQVQRTQGVIGDHTVRWDTNNIDPNMFLSSKSYIKLSVTVQKREVEEDSVNPLLEEEDIPSAFTDRDKILKKPGMVLHNACSSAKVRMNNHEIEYKDLRYLTKKLNMSFAGREINDNYLTSSGGPYDGYTGDYDISGNVDCFTRSLTMPEFGFDVAGGNTFAFFPRETIFTFTQAGFSADSIGAIQNTFQWTAATEVGTFAAGTGVPINLRVAQSVFNSGDTFTLNGGATTFRYLSVIDGAPSTTIHAERLNGAGDFALYSLNDNDAIPANRDFITRELGISTIIFGDGVGGGDDVTPVVDKFSPGDRLFLDDAAGVQNEFEVIGIVSPNIIQVENINNSAVIIQKIIDVDDFIIQKFKTGGCCDPWHEESADDASRDIEVGHNTTSFDFTEPLSFGPFNHLADYGGPLHNSKGSSNIDHKCWYNRMTDLIPYIRQLGLTMTFDSISDNALIYLFGDIQNVRVNEEARRWCKLVDVAITSAELVLFWIKPRKEKIMGLPPTIRIQSWQYDHNQFDLGDVLNGDTVSSSEKNILTNQQPAYLMYYGMVDKDSDSYNCYAVSNANKNDPTKPTDYTANIDINSVEAGMRLGDIRIQELLDFRNDLGFSVGLLQNTIAWTQATHQLVFAQGGGDPVDLINIQTLRPNDTIILNKLGGPGEIFSVSSILNATTAIAIRLDSVGDVAAQTLQIADEIIRLTNTVNTSITIRSNTLGGDDIISTDYNIKELYRFTLKNSISDFPYGETKFRGVLPSEANNATYPSEFYLLLSEGDLNTFFVRKGQTQRSVVMDYDSNLVANDGYSLNKDIIIIEDTQDPDTFTAFDDGSREYALHIFYIYDRYYIELTKEGNVTSGFDANFF